MALLEHSFIEMVMKNDRVSSSHVVIVVVVGRFYGAPTVLWMPWHPAVTFVFELDALV